MKSYWVTGHKTPDGIFRTDRCFEVVASDHSSVPVRLTTVAFFALESDASEYAERKNVEEGGK